MMSYNHPDDVIEEPTYLKKVLIEKSISYETLGNLTGLSESSIQRYVNGERRPSWGDAKRISQVLGLSDSEFRILFDPVIIVGY